jgi:hypothetical protein
MKSFWIVFSVIIAIAFAVFIVKLNRIEHTRRQYRRIEGFNSYPISGTMRAMRDYLSSHHGRYPNAAHWEDAIRPYWKMGGRPFTVLLYTPPGDQQHRLAMNKNLSDVSQQSIDKGQVVLLYETRSDHKNTYGDPILLPNLHHDDGIVQDIICGDGRNEEGKWGCGTPKPIMKSEAQ